MLQWQYSSRMIALG